MPRARDLASLVLAAAALTPFAFFAACADSDDAATDAGAGGGDTGSSGNSGGSEEDSPFPYQDGAPTCAPASSLAPAIPTAALTGSVGGEAFPPASPAAYARPIATLDGFYEVRIADQGASCANPDGGTRGVRLVVPPNGQPCSAAPPATAEFFAPEYGPRPAGVENVIRAKPEGSTMTVGMVIGAFASGDLPADGLSGTTKVPICP